MPDLFLIIVILLFALAILDLIVGVSNDAVNFLNSAVGSKVAPRYIIMIVASLGIFVGATFSSGMMEVARKGIFNPEFFYFSEIMAIFLAVMLTDIILLDLFNTFGLPTSTTVSIVFELLGAAVIISLLKISASGETYSALGNYINSSSALAIISGIFLSIGIAFLVGAILQFLSRVLFTFHYEKRLHWVGGVWGGLALTAMMYFLLIKGIKGASFVSDEFIGWVKGNTLLLVGLSFIFWTLVVQVLLSVFKVNILRVIVLFGTFSLAMAFAGNDLVNFIGVPIAGFESFNAWSVSGADPEQYAMTALNEPVRTKTFLLLLAGLIMVATLWFSKKARSVTETEVNLGRQDEGSERFSPNALSRGLVRYSMIIGKGIQAVIPQSWQKKAGQSFLPDNQQAKEEKENDPAAFDLVRASVNLTVASMLIAFATSLRLPLSTTYVSFMVAMGTSLADQAWGRDSAAYRVAGVLNVIAGWFFTALIAFSVAGLFAFLIYSFGPWAIGFLVALAIFFISRTFVVHRKREKAKEKFKAFEIQNSRIPGFTLASDTAKKVADTLECIAEAYQNAISGLLKEERSLIRQAKENLKELKEENKELKHKLFKSIQRIEEESTEASRMYLLVYDLEQDVLQSTTSIVEACDEHVENSHKPLKPVQVKNLKEIVQAVDLYLQAIMAILRNSHHDQISGIMDQKQALFLALEKLIAKQVVGIKKSKYGRRNSLLVFTLQFETKDLVAGAARFAKLFYRLKLMKSGGEALFNVVE